MTTLYEYVEDLIGVAPNSFVENLYYVLCVVLVIFFCKVMLSVMRSIFRVSRY